jgi:hypothetical protein
VSPWQLTVRHGPRVASSEWEELDAAIAALRDAAVSVVREGPLESIQGFREYEPAEQVAARLTLRHGRFLRARTAGVDVMGDGRLVAFAGSVRRRELDGKTADAAIAAVRESLA